MFASSPSHANSTPTPSVSQTGSEALVAEAERRRIRAVKSGCPYDIAAYGRYLQEKQIDFVEGARWKRRAQQILDDRLIPNVTAQESYFNTQFSLR